MRGFPRYHHIYTFAFILVVLILFRRVFSINVNTFSSSNSLTLFNNRTIVSSSDVFELGFFKITSSSPDDDRWYLGIWYKKIPERTYVWVANRDDPLSTSSGTLKISDNKLLLLDQVDTPIVSWNLSGGGVRSPVVAELLDNGNFVVKESKANNPNGFLWQSFDFPTDTLLPQMKMGWDRKTANNRFLRSWKSPYDPSSGDYSYKLEIQGLPQFYLWTSNAQVFRSGPWDGIRFSGMPEMQRWNNADIVYNFTDNREEIAFTFRDADPSSYSRLKMSTLGLLELSTWVPTTPGWKNFWISSINPCDMYEECGPYSYCDTNTLPMCNCIKGFDPMNSDEWNSKDGSSGCVRRTPLSCKEKEFVQLKKMKLPDTTEVTVDRIVGVEECQNRCITDCNCTAFANVIRNGGLGCVIWTRKLQDMRNYPDSGQDLYVKVAASDLGEERDTNKIIISVTVGVTVMLLLSFIIVCFWKRKQKRTKTREAPIERNQNLLMNGVVISSGRHLSDLSEESIAEDLELPLMEFNAIAMATKNFSDCNKLGEGGFGSVYKGRLANGQDIAVKRLSEMSHQGTNEFKNEVKLIARLQHINLVRILGCCFNAKEKVLIYEYLENLSLDRYLFDKTRSSKLNWQKRFDIANGIARGILYLHQDSRCKIIHRDLKASNVLLDKDMTPKISDFGMARIFARDDGEAITRRIVGTYGYMSPEYAMEGIFSVKSDVFSFGVLLLEIVSGKRNRGFDNSNHDSNLLGYTWRNWKEGKGLDILDPIIVDPSSSSPLRTQEILRCIQIGLLCVQELSEDRPTMSSVILMLGSETALIPEPKPPGYWVGRSPETFSSSSKQQDDESFTVNQITLSIIDAR
uniref:Receptor-like serine/threonine-protein kinase n=3 Tax=Arabidopsis TaxID=3701 RepID=A0A068CQL8_ARALY|nr:SRKp [Arabidopsis lyrata]